VSTAEIEVRQPRPQALAAALPAKIQYAKALADSGLLPKQYQNWPANVLWAMEYAEMLHLPPMAAMTGVHVIEGKPTASAGLISALVRKAGHRLRIGYSEAAMTGWAEIVRSDDPDYTFRSEWNLERAVIAELCTIKDGKPFALDSKGRSLPWRKFFPSMTKARATTEVARDACEEVLFGLHYTPEELGAEVDEDGVVMAGSAQGSAEPPQDAQVVETDTEWLEATLRIIPSIGLDACRKLWTETREKFRAGQLAETEQARVLDLLTARMEAVKPAVQGAAAEPPCEAVAAEAAAALDPDGPWALKVEEIAEGDLAAAREALDEAATLLTSGTIDVAAFEAIEAAILARFPDAGREAVAT
jgi:hypothetical protein